MCYLGKENDQMKFARENLRRFTPAQIIVFYYFLAIAFSFSTVKSSGRLFAWSGGFLLTVYSPR